MIVTKQPAFDFLIFLLKNRKTFLFWSRVKPLSSSGAMSNNRQDKANLDTRIREKSAMRTLRLFRETLLSRP